MSIGPLGIVGWAVVGVLVLLLASMAACRPWRTAGVQRRSFGRVFVLPGIEGAGWFNGSIGKGLDDGGLRGQIEVHDWTTGAGYFAWFLHLADGRRRRQEAARLAGIIVEYHDAYPDQPIQLVAHSGGAGVALLACGMLPGELVDAVILLGPAVSPTYDLTDALAGTQRGIWNFYSRYDLVFLALGTTLFGTVDRRHAAAAGLLGFARPPYLGPDGERLYAEKLHQVPYTPAMRSSGHGGGHHGWTSRRFARDWLAPILRAAEAAPSFVHR